jgi:hypothetical protein
MTFIISYQIFFFFLLIIFPSIELNSHLKSPLLKSLIQRRQILDGTAKSGGVAPKPPGSDHVFNNNPVAFSSPQPTSNQIFPMLTTTIIINELEEDRSIKETASTNSSSKSGLLASILAPTGILGLIGAVVGAFLYKKNQTNSATNDNTGFLNNFFSRNSNAIIQNKLEEKYLPVGNIS